MVEPGPQVKVLIVDDEQDMRRLLRMLIDEANHGLQVVAEAEDGAGALHEWQQQRPTVIVLDNRMPGMTGLEIAAEILRQQPDQPIVLFTAYADGVTVATANDLGVQCLSKTELDRVPESIWAAAGT
jgi:YesN/AraC family two-component response regulator